MKNLLKLLTLLAICATISFSTTSCKDDETCYECDEYDDGFGNIEPAFTVCEGDEGDNGEEITEEQLEASITLLNAFGYNCTKK